MSDPDGFYKILGVAPGASAQDVKKAWGRLMKQYNPDMGSLAREARSSITDEGQLKARIKELSDFCCKVNEAKEYLCDPEKKKSYDAGVGKDGPQFESGGMGSIFDVFSMFTGGRSSGRERVKKVRDTSFVVKVSFKESFVGKTSKFRVKRNVVCVKCSGKGGESFQDCGRCRGEGKYRIEQRMGHSVIYREVSCDVCKGEGNIIKGPKCGDCTGKGMKMAEEMVSVVIKPGVKDKETIKFEKKGDEMPGCVTGDLIFQITVLEDTGPYNFRRAGDDLIADVKIDLFDALAGTRILFKCLDGRDVLINVPRIEDLKKAIVVSEEGFKNDYTRGNLVIKPDYVIPQGYDLYNLKEMMENRPKQTFGKCVEVECFFGDMPVEKQQQEDESEEEAHVRFSGFPFF